jgi:hypothetical protein
MLIPYTGPPATPKPLCNNPDLQVAQHTDHLICTFIFLGQCRPVPCCQALCHRSSMTSCQGQGTFLIFPFTQWCYSASQSLHLGRSSYRAIISWGLAVASILVHYCGLSPQSPILYFTYCGYSLCSPLLEALPYRHTPYIVASL